MVLDVCRWIGLAKRIRLMLVSLLFVLLNGSVIIFFVERAYFNV